MAAQLQEWRVRPHGPITQVDANIFTVVGQVHMPVGDLPRRMTAVRLDDGQLVIFSAIVLDEDEMQKLESLGEPTWLIVPSDHHRLDAKAWKDRYPALRVIAPEGARENVAKAVPVDATTADFGDAGVAFVTVPGTRGHESALEAHGPQGTTLVLNDIVANIRRRSGFGGWMLRVMGFAGEQPHVPLPVKASMVDDKEALQQQLLEWASVNDLKRVLVSHGDPIETDPQGALRELAASLQ